MKHHHFQRGQALPLIAIAALVLVGVTGFAVDAGYDQYQQRLQQTATDSAALAGARELSMGDYHAAALQDAKNNGYTDNTAGKACDATAGRICVQVYNPPQASDAFSGDGDAVQVTITVNQPSFFERVFGIGKVPVTTNAVAILQSVPANNCLYVLNGQANFNGQTGGGTVNAPNCGLAFNQSANFHNATVNAASIECASTCSQGTFIQATPQPAAPASDPCPAISFCAHMANPAPACTTTTPAPKVTNNQPVTVQYGCYNNLDLSKASSVTFTCGLYVITGTLNASANGNNASPINISQSCGTGGPGGVTFYLTCTTTPASCGSINMRNDNINLTAPTSGDYAQYTAGEQNVLLYQSPADTSTVNLQSASCQTGCQSFFSGMIYAPNATLNYNQYSTTTSGDVLIIAGTLNANGGLNSLFNGPGGPPNITIQVPVLGE